MTDVLAAVALALLGEVVVILLFAPPPTIAHALARWAARVRHVDNPVRARIRAEQAVRDIDSFQSPQKKLLQGLAQAGAALAFALRRMLPGADRLLPAVRTDLESIGILNDMFTELGDLRQLRGRWRTRHGRLTTYLERLLRQPVEAFDPAAATQALGIAASVSGRLVDDRNERAAIRLVELTRPLADRHPDQPVVLRLRQTSAHAIMQLNDLPQAEQLLRGLHFDHVRVLGEDHEQTLDTQRLLAWSLVRQQRLGEARNTFEDLKARAQRLTSTPGHLPLHVKCMDSWLMRCEGRLEEATGSYLDVVTGRTRVLGPDDPDTLDSRHSLAQVLLATGDLAAARAELKRLHRQWRRGSGAGHPNTLETRKFLAIASARPGFLGTAVLRWRLRRILAWQTKRVGADHYQSLGTRQLLATLPRRRTTPATTRRRTGHRAPTEEA
ncbi:tetratricopeptide repeat protein [Polymorphospora sp. NPDC051019]|uniref:tetratricopeptide repeat protein n=1 Tax=Polymorphospora sp. NPDC051019 TaxID=3155725 RepID=UPI00342EBE4C